MASLAEIIINKILITDVGTIARAFITIPSKAYSAYIFDIKMPKMAPRNHIKSGMAVTPITDVPRTEFVIKKQKETIKELKNICQKLPLFLKSK